MNGVFKLSAERSALVVVDVQEAFRRYDCFSAVATSARRLLTAARLLELPRVVTEQYPKGLGPTVAEVGLEGEVPLAKRAFSAVRAEGFDLGGRDQAIVCGLETHVCVLQTVLDLLAAGVEVYVVGDGVGSRHRVDHELGMRRLEREGARPASVEMAIFELLGGAEHPQFKALQELIK